MALAPDLVHEGGRPDDTRDIPRRSPFAARALAQDPLSAARRHTRAVQLGLDRRSDAAIEECRRTIELDATYAVAYQVMASLSSARGMYQEALPLIETATRLNPSNAIFLAILGHIHGNLKQESDARRILEQLSAQTRQRYIPAFAFAVVHAGLDEKDQAFAWLEKAYDERENRLAILAADPTWDRLRSDPRFDKLLRRVGLPR